MFESIWMLLTVVGPIVLAAAIAYALFTRRRLTPHEKVRQEKKVDELYHDTPAEHREAVVEAEIEDRQRARQNREIEMTDPR